MPSFAARLLGNLAMPPPYEDKTLPTDEWCACGKNLWKLTERQ